MRIRTSLVAVAVAAATAACSGDDAGTGEDDSRFATTIENALERARELGASDVQIELLEEAQRAGEVSFEVYNEAIERSLRCLREQGFEPDEGYVTHDQGYPFRLYGVPTEAEDADAVEFAPGATVHRCVADHSHWIEVAYQNQPSSVEAAESHQRAVYEPHREAIVACALEEGIDIDPDGDILEIVGRSIAAYNEGETEVYCTDGIS